MTTALSPKGATENSQGCQPLGQGPNHSQSPERAPETPSPRWGYSYGLGSLSRGYHPWLFSVAPLGLAKASILAAAVVCFLLGRFPILAQSVSRAEQELNFAKAEVQKLRLAKEADKQNRMYEDIEIMRRIMDQTLVKLPEVAKAQQAYRSRGYGFAGGGMGGMGMSGMGGMGMSGIGGMGMGGMAGMSGTWGIGGGGLYSAASFMSEGTYLRNYGVMYAVTLPPLQRDPKPAPVKAAAKPLSDWERTKKELLGEKVEETKDSQGQPVADMNDPTVADAILRLLADNGKNFSQLAENENITVIVTFRDPAGNPQANSEQYYNPAFALIQKATSKTKAESAGNHDLQGSKVLAELEKHRKLVNEEAYRQALLKADVEAAYSNSTPKSARDYKLLGDLHLKQGNLKAAFETYEKAWTMVGERDMKDGLRDSLLQNLAQVAVQLGAFDRARYVLETLGPEKKQQKDEPKKEAKQTDARATVFASKLIITAPKRLLDQVGGGKITFAEFKKSATVEYLTFGEAEKKPAGDKPEPVKEKP